MTGSEPPFFIAGLGPVLFQLPDYQMIEKCGVPNSAEPSAIWTKQKRKNLSIFPSSSRPNT
jgi:hypothetical protein